MVKLTNCDDWLVKVWHRNSEGKVSTLCHRKAENTVINNIITEQYKWHEIQPLYKSRPCLLYTSIPTYHSALQPLIVLVSFTTLLHLFLSLIFSPRSLTFIGQILEYTCHSKLGFPLFLDENNFGFRNSHRRKSIISLLQVTWSYSLWTYTNFTVSSPFISNWSSSRL